MKVFPETLNYLPVIKAEAHANGMVTVMVHNPEDATPYVVASWWPECGSQWSWGHYCYDKAQADWEFGAVSERNAARGRIAA